MHKRICPICEAACGLEIATDGRTVTGIVANKADVFSGGHICAKGLSLAELDADPDRLRTPLVRRNGVLEPATFDEAWQVILERLSAIRKQSGADAVASYIGNPTAHNFGMSRGLGVFLATLGSKNVFSAGTVDQVPKQLASSLMFGDDMAIPVPDIERADFILMLGANPVVSNGSLWMVPGFPDKLRDFRIRGGALVTVDPRRSETARLADDHLGIIPGTDAWLLAALINEMKWLGADIPATYPVSGWQQLAASLDGVTTVRAAEVTGIAPERIVMLAESMLAAKAAVTYGRVGTTLQQFGTLTSFLIEVLNLMTGALDKTGGAMFPEQPFASPGQKPQGAEYGRYHSRVSGVREVLGQMPVGVLAEEIQTPGEGQIRALVCFAGNPVISNPDSTRVAAALSTLDLLVCVDIYHNETTRLADVILPGTSPFEDGHYDQFLGSMGYRNVARYSPPIFSPPQLPEWEIGLGLTCLLKNGRVPTQTDLRDCEDDVVAAAISAYTMDADSPLYERDVQEILAMIGPESGVERILDLGVRAGRFGDHFGEREGLTLLSMRDTPDGIDLGELRAGRLEELLNTASGRVELAPQLVLQELETLIQTAPEATLRLIGRRGTNTNNSWLGNLTMLSKGRRQCTLEIHPDDAAAVGIETGDSADVTTGSSRISVEVVVTDLMSPGVVSLPHGFSLASDLRQNKRQRGGNYNELIPVTAVDGPSGTAALNGYPVTVTKSG